MVVSTSDIEFTVAVPPAKLFRSMVLDFKNLIKKLNPGVKSVEYIQGDGGSGTITRIVIQEGEQLKVVKNRIDAVDPDSFSYSYAYLEGEGLVGKLESIAYEVQFTPYPDGGSSIKIKATYTAKGDVEPTEEEIKVSKEKTIGLFNAVAAYLLQNPEAYA
ncbi:hypothetical protein K2173_009131 [Erythroxylum novogranatense]|uniref:Bet v I/Major latex protein domain-containing protein n=1 Tax=Erythroxylum novogranatense TaxID=1862640 RepID=A0AAV8TLE5_9ROSI|nr:hypothetical protein K2173_009131 [Erythroxylum novogranatense]